MQVLIIIINYNTKKLTADCIDSIMVKTSVIEYEIIPVENAPSDGIQVQLCSDERILFLETGESLGFGKVNNLGVQHAKESISRFYLLHTKSVL